MRRRVLMVYPEIPMTYWSLNHSLRISGEKTLMPPLGLITVAAMLPESYDIRLVDMNFQGLTRDDIEWADIVFVSAMIVQKESFSHVVRLCKVCGVPVAAGGPYPTTSHESIEDVDYFILNEGEITLPRFIEDYENGMPQRIYTDETKPDITKTPLPRFDLLDVKAYSTMALQNSRGCPFNCEFCDIIEMFGRSPRYKKPEQFIREMKEIYSLGYRGPLFIVDDNFIGNKRKVKELLREIIIFQMDHDYPFSLFTEASINLAEDDELLELFVRSGMDMVFVGLETPDEEILKSNNKQQNVKTDLHDSVMKVQASGIEVLAGFILGFDNEEDNIFDRQIEFIQKAGIPMAMVGLLLALPKTQLHRRLHREGRLLGDTDGNNTHSLKLNFTPTMDPVTLKEGYKRVLSEIYRPANYFERCMILLKRFPESRFTKKTKITRRDMRALMISLWKQTFSTYGFRYLWFLLWVILHNIKNFPFAVALAVKGHHFFIITNDIIKSDEFKIYCENKVVLMEEMLKMLVLKNPVIRPARLKHTGMRYVRAINRKYRWLPSGAKIDAEAFHDEYIGKCFEIIEKYQRRGSGKDMVSLETAPVRGY